MLLYAYSAEMQSFQPQMFEIYKGSLGHCSHKIMGHKKNLNAITTIISEN